MYRKFRHLHSLCFQHLVLAQFPYEGHDPAIMLCINRPMTKKNIWGPDRPVREGFFGMAEEEEKIVAVDANIAELDTKIADVDAKIEKVDANIAENDKAITKIEADICGVDAELSECQVETEKENFRVEKTQLRDEKKQLRDEKKLLRGGKNQLLEEKQQLQGRKIHLLQALNRVALTPSTTEWGATQLILTFDKYRGSGASGFTASESSVPVNCAFNGTFLVSFNLPSIVRTAIGIQVSEDILNDAVSAVEAGRLFTIFPVKVGETGSGRTVAETAGLALKEFFADKSNQISALPQTMLSTINAGIGPASAISRPDLLCVHSEECSSTGLLVGELKDTVCGPLEMLGQAFVSAVNLLMRQRQIGLDAKEVAVPLILSTGNLMQFAWATTLDPFFPILTVTSRVLDLSDPLQLREASEALARTKMFCREQATRLKKCQTRDFQMVPALNMDMYHLKSKEQIFNRYEGKDISDTGLAYLWRIFEALKDVEEVVKPLGYAISEKDKKNAEFLIFPKLDGSFKMGVPTDAEEFNEYMTAVSHAIKRLHRNHVVHVDLYPSNILWYRQDGKIIIRIVDWDSATFIGDAFTPKMSKVFVSEDEKFYYWMQSGHAEPKCDAWFVFTLSNLSEEEQKAMHGDVSTVNLTYRGAVDRQLQSYGGRVSLNAQFETWFSSWNEANNVDSMETESGGSGMEVNDSQGSKGR